MFKIKAIATLYVGKSEQGEAERLKTVKLQVGRGTTVRDFVNEALKKASLGPSFGCVDVQYSSKKFNKFLDVDYDEIVKDGREYNVRVIWSLLAIKKMEDKAIGNDAAVMEKEDDLSTCKSYKGDHEGLLTCPTGVADKKVDETELNLKMHNPTYAEVVSSGGKAKDIVVAEEVNVDASERVEEIDKGLKAPKQIDEIEEDIGTEKNADSAKEHIATFSEQQKYGQDTKEHQKVEGVVEDVPSSDLPPSTPPPSDIKKKGWFEVFSSASRKRGAESS